MLAIGPSTSVRAEATASGSTEVTSKPRRTAHRGLDGTMDTVVAPEVIRNFSIISHVDHGKSTLSDRILELTGAVDPRDMREQYLDSMDIERERGITIKAQNVRVHWRGHVLHLIDTPGHVDFGYEVSRSLAACEGAVLLVDASQGIQAQTLANCYLALEHDLEIVAVLNKIDLPAADPERYAAEIETRARPARRPRSCASRPRPGEGVPELLDAVVAPHPRPDGGPRRPAAGADLRLVLRPVPGRRERGPGRRRHAARRGPAALHAGGRDPRGRGGRGAHPRPGAGRRARAGEVGYLIAGIKDVGEARVGETVTEAARPATEPLEGYRGPQADGLLRDLPHRRRRVPRPSRRAREAQAQRRQRHLRARDERRARDSVSAAGSSACCTWTSSANGSSASSASRSSPRPRRSSTSRHLTNGEALPVDNPTEMPEPQYIDHIDEPVLKLTIITPAEYTGTIMDLCQTRRGRLSEMEYLSPERVELIYELPLAEVVLDFFDVLKSRTKGYASLDYEPAGLQTANLVKVDVLLAGSPVDAFSTIVHRSKADDYGRKMTAKLRELIPRQLFDVPIQAAIGGRIVARETVKAKRKDVLAKCYGGDITRKRKLLEKQKEGKKRMKSIGRRRDPPGGLHQRIDPGGVTKRPGSLEQTRTRVPPHRFVAVQSGTPSRISPRSL